MCFVTIKICWQAVLLWFQIIRAVLFHFFLFFLDMIHTCSPPCLPGLSCGNIIPGSSSGSFSCKIDFESYTSCHMFAVRGL